MLLIFYKTEQVDSVYIPITIYVVDVKCKTASFFDHFLARKRLFKNLFHYLYAEELIVLGNCEIEQIHKLLSDAERVLLL